MHDWRTEADLLVERRGVEAAYKTLLVDTEAGNPTAALCLAQWRLTGHLIRRDLAEARRFYGLAAKSLEEARQPYIALLANGAGGCDRAWRQALNELQNEKIDEASVQIALLNRMNIDGAGNPTDTFAPEIPQSVPHISVFRSFLTAAESKYLRSVARPRLQRATVVHPTTGLLIHDPIRKSSSTAFSFVEETPVIHAINRRIGAATGTQYEQGEPLQVLSYGEGDEYKLHSDAMANVANQRLSTFLIYLNEDYSGGATEFPNLDFQFKGGIGDAIWFENADKPGRPLSATNHLGGKVTSGKKVIASKWIRAKQLDISGPPGRPF